MNMMNNNNPKMDDRNWKDVRISVDIIEKVHSYIDFLQSYIKHSHLWESSNTVKRALYRYEKYWLPLVAEWKIGDLEPPRDIKWAWHLHMLNPRHYVEYCQGRFGKVIPHKLKTSMTEEKSAKERTARVWKDKYLHEPYELETEVLMCSSHHLQPSNKLAHLVSTTSHQSAFLYQVLLPHYVDTTFLHTALERYRQFIYVQKQVPNFCAEPPYDIHLLWRVHMMHPYEYHLDMERSLRRVLDPHDMLAEVTGYMTSTGDAEECWGRFFNDPLFVGGTFYRGGLARGIHTVSKEHNIQEIVDSCSITIDDVLITEIWTKEKDIIVEAKRLGESSFTYQSIFTEKGKAGTPITNSNHKGLGTIEFDSKCHRGIEFHIFCKKGRFCIKAEKHIATVFYNPLSSFMDNSFFTKTMPVEIQKVSVTDPHVKFTCHIKAVDRKPHVLTMDRTPFSSGQIPSDLLQCVMAEPYWQQSEAVGMDEEFLVARHVLNSKLGPLTFSCEVIKHEVTDSAAILLYLNNTQLVCVAHTISPEQLPNVDQVSRACPFHMDPHLDLAMLIRNSSGDWCIVKGSWMSETMPGYGKVQITVFNLQKNITTKHIIRDDELQSIKLDHVTIDMPTGRLTLGTGCEEMAENIVLGFCVGIMFLTCQKKAVMIPAMNGSMRSLNRLQSYDLDDPNVFTKSQAPPQAPASRFSAKVKLQNRKRTRRRKMSASFTFLLACGLQVDSYFYNNQSQPSSRNSTITLNDVPVVTNQEGDVKFVANVNNGSVIMSNGNQYHLNGNNRTSVVNGGAGSNSHLYQKHYVNHNANHHPGYNGYGNHSSGDNVVVVSNGGMSKGDVIEYDDPNIQDIRL